MAKEKPLSEIAVEFTPEAMNKIASMRMAAAEIEQLGHIIEDIATEKEGGPVVLHRRKGK